MKKQMLEDLKKAYQQVSSTPVSLNTKQGRIKVQNMIRLAAAIAQLEKEDRETYDWSRKPGKHEPEKYLFLGRNGEFVVHDRAEVKVFQELSEAMDYLYGVERYE